MWKEGRKGGWEGRGKKKKKKKKKKEASAREVMQRAGNTGVMQTDALSFSYRRHATEL